MDLKGDPLRSAASGALGAIIAETVADVLTRHPHEALLDMMSEAKAEGRELTRQQYLQAYQEEVHRHMDIGRLCAGIAAVLTRSDASLAIMTANNALENNFAMAIPIAAALTPEILAGLGLGITGYQLGQWLKDQPFVRDMLPEGAFWEDKGFMPEENQGQILITPGHDHLPWQEGYKGFEDALPLTLVTPQADDPTALIFTFAKKLDTQSHQRPLLPGEGKVGTYGQLKQGQNRFSDLAAHHIPNDQYMKTKGVNRNNGIAINVEHPVPGNGGRHREIHKRLQRQDPSLAPRDALAQGIWRAREVYKQDGVYTPEVRNSLQTVIEQNKEQHPTLFQKEGNKK